MIARIRQALAAWFCTRSHRRRTGGVWFHVIDRSGGWSMMRWTKTVDDGCELLEIEDYRTRRAPATIPDAAEAALPSLRRTANGRR